MSSEEITPAEKKLIKLLRGLEGADSDFRVLCGLTCRAEGLTEDLVDYIESNKITKSEDVDRWLFGEPYTDDRDSLEEEVDDDVEYEE